MARFLRDELVSNSTIDSEALSQLVVVFTNLGTSMPEFVASEGQETRDVHLFYTIRFDEKGYRVFDKEELLGYFEQASKVDRIFFNLGSGESIRTNGVLGSALELRLDKDENANSYLTVTSDDENWVNSSFSAVKEAIAKYKNKNYLVRNPWVELILQLLGLFLGFAISLWAASNMAPSLAIENAFLISFLLVLLIFSNLWTPINQKLHRFIHTAFPTIRFYRPARDRLHWLYQAIVGGVVVAATIYLLGLIFSYVGEILGAFVERGA